MDQACTLLAIALPAVPATIRVQLKWTFGVDLDVLCRFYVEYSGTAPTTAQLNTMATAVATAWNSDLAPQTCNQATLTEVILEDLTSSTSAVGSATVTHVGSNGNWSGTLASAMLINFLVSRRYRGGKPRMYHPPMASSSLTNPDQWGSTNLAAFQTGWNSFLTAVLAAVWTGGGSLAQVSVSYYDGFTVFTGPTGRARNIPKLRTGGPVIDTVGSAVANARPANQRRRLGKR